MTRGEKGLLYAPDTTFEYVAEHLDQLPQFLGARLTGFWLEPSRRLIADGHDWAAATVLIGLLEALVHTRNVAEGRNEGEIPALRSFVTDFGIGAPEARGRFVDDVRNGLVHYGRISRAGEIDARHDSSISMTHGVLVFNPSLLARELEGTILRVIKMLAVPTNAERWRRNFERIFKRELAAQRAQVT